MTDNDKTNFANQIVNLCFAHKVPITAATDVIFRYTQVYQEFTIRHFLQKVHPYLRKEVRLVLLKFYGELDESDEDCISKLEMEGRFARAMTGDKIPEEFVVHCGRRAGSTTLCQIAAAYEAVRSLKSIGKIEPIAYYSQHNKKELADLKEIQDCITRYDPKIQTAIDPSGDCMDFYLDGLRGRITFHDHALFFPPEGVIRKMGYGVLISDDQRCSAELSKSYPRSLQTFTRKEGYAVAHYATAYADGRAMAIEHPNTQAQTAKLSGELRAIRL